MKQKKSGNNFNIVVAGVGGEGLVTLIQIIAKAAMAEGRDVRTSELHGLSQRGGMIEAHVRFGKKINSPLVSRGEADLALGLEMLEGLRAYPYCAKNGVFLINRKKITFEGDLSEREIVRDFNDLKRKFYIISASEICKKEFGFETVSSVYLLGYAVFNKLIPLKPESVLRAIEDTVKPDYFEINKKAFNLAKQNKEYGD